MTAMEPVPVRVVCRTFFGIRDGRRCTISSVCVGIGGGVPCVVDVRCVWSHTVGVDTDILFCLTGGGGGCSVLAFFVDYFNRGIFECFKSRGVVIIELVSIPVRRYDVWKGLDVASAFSDDGRLQRLKFASSEHSDCDTVRSEPSGAPNSMHVRCPARWNVQVDH